MKLVVSLIIVMLFISACSSTATRKETKKVHDLADLQVRLGLGYMQKGNLQVAMEKLLASVETADDYAPAHNGIALLYTRLGMVDEADEHYLRSIELAPGNGVGHNNYGAFLCDQKRYAESYVHFTQAAEIPLYTTPALAYENAGLCALRQENFKDAEVAFRKALEIDRRLTVSLINMVEIALHNNKFLQGRAFIQRFEEVTVHNARTLLMAIQVEQGMGDDAQVADYNDQLRRRFPDAYQMNQLIE